MNLEEEAKKISELSTDSISDIATQCDSLILLQDKIKKTEESLKDLKEQIEEESGWIVEFSAFKKHEKR